MSRYGRRAMSTPWTYAGSPPALSHCGQHGHPGRGPDLLPVGARWRHSCPTSRTACSSSTPACCPAGSCGSTGTSSSPSPPRPTRRSRPRSWAAVTPRPGEADAGISSCSATAASATACASASSSATTGSTRASVVVELVCDARLRRPVRGQGGPRPAPHGNRPGTTPRPGTLGHRRRRRHADHGLGRRRRRGGRRRAGDLALRAGAPRGAGAVRRGRGAVGRGRPCPPRFGCGDDDEASVPAQRYAAWLGTAPTVDTDAPVARRRGGTGDPRTSARCASSTPTIPSSRSSPRARRGS